MSHLFVYLSQFGARSTSSIIDTHICDKVLHIDTEQIGYDQPYKVHISFLCFPSCFFGKWLSIRIQHIRTNADMSSNFNTKGQLDPLKLLFYTTLFSGTCKFSKI